MFTYDFVGNLDTVTEVTNRGIVTKYEYDHRDRLIADRQVAPRARPGDHHQSRLTLAHLDLDGADAESVAGGKPKSANASAAPSP